MPDVEAHITGTVWKIEVQIGETVQEGDTVVVLEKPALRLKAGSKQATEAFMYHI